IPWVERSSGEPSSFDRSFSGGSMRDIWSAASFTEEGHVRYAALAGRQLFSMIFIIASAGHFNSQTIESAARHGVPLPDFLVPLSGVIALVGGLSVLLGYHTRFGAWLLVTFLIPVTLVMHNFWVAPDAMAFQVEQGMFLRNVTMFGGGLLIAYFAGGRRGVH